MNNLKVVCIFGVIGSLTFLIEMIFFIYSESSVSIEISRTKAGSIIGQTTWILVILGYFLLHFLAGRRFIYPTGNIFFDIKYYIAIFILAIVCICIPFILFTILFSAGYLIGGIIQQITGVSYVRLSFFIATVLSIIFQFLGVLSKQKL